MTRESEYCILQERKHFVCFLLGIGNKTSFSWKQDGGLKRKNSLIFLHSDVMFANSRCQ